MFGKRDERNRHFSKKSISLILAGLMATSSVLSVNATSTDNFNLISYFTENVKNTIDNTNILNNDIIAINQTAKVTASFLNVRQEASTSSDVLGQLTENTLVQIIGYTGNGWTKIAYESGFAFVSSDYLDYYENLPYNDTMKLMYGTANVSAAVSVRTGPWVSFSKIGELDKNEKINIIGYFPLNNWFKISYKNFCGYITGNNIKNLNVNIVIQTTPTTTLPTTTLPPTTTTTTTLPPTTATTTSTTQVTTLPVVTYEKGETTANLNLRSSPSTSSSVKTVIPKSSTIKIISKNGDWYSVEYGSYSGYVFGSYVKIIETQTTTTTLPPTTTTTTTLPPTTTTTTLPVVTYQKGETTANLNLRSSPSTSSSVKTVIPKSTTIKIISKNSDWYNVEYGSYNGYVFGSYIKIIETPTTTTLPTTIITTTIATTVGNDGFVELKATAKTTENLNFRNAPNTTSSTVLKVIPQYTKIEVIAQKDGWYKIIYQNTEGYVSASFVELIDDETEEPTYSNSLDASGTAVVKSTVNIRTGPGLNYTKLGTFATDTTLSLKSRVRVDNVYWYGVDYNGSTVFVNGDNLNNFNIKLDASNSVTKSDELRGVWLSFIEMNFATGWDNEKICREKVSTMFDDVAKADMNAVFVHVRPFADSYYPSEYFPWSAYVTGTQGKPADFDPLEIMVNEAHARGLEFHAWINPYRISTSSNDYKDLSEDNMARIWLEQNPNDTKVIKWENGLYYNPASEEVRELVVNGVKEIVENYNVDGIHFDDYFYPTTDKYIDSEDYKAYTNSGGQLTLAQWRTQNVNDLIKQCYSSIKSINSNIEFGISPQGNIENNTDELYADVYEWCSTTGYIDYIVPQIYFGFNHYFAPFDQWTDDWINLVKLDSVKLHIGLGAYRSGVNQGGTTNQQYEWINNTDVLKRQLEYLRYTQECGGFVLFSYNSLWDDSANSYSKKELENLLSIIK